ncbi:MAG: MFS transporter, partial [Desulfobacteraceae bacterium]
MISDDKFSLLDVCCEWRFLKMQWRSYYTVWLVMSFGWITNYMVRAGLSPVLLPIIDEFNLTYGQAGLIAAAVFYSYAAMQFPAGVIGDKIGRKTVLVVCTFGWGVMSLLTGLAQSFISLFMFRLTTGIAQGTYFSNDRSIIAYYTPKEKAGFGQGVSFIGLGIGLSIGIILSGVISEHLGWRWVFYLFCIPSVLASLLIAYTIDEPVESNNNYWDNFHTSVSIKSAFTTYDLWIIYIAGIAGIYGQWMLGSWGPAMFKEVGVETLSAGSAFASVVGLSAVPGLIVNGILSDILYRKGISRKAVAMFDFLLGALLLGLVGAAIQLKVHPVMLVALMFCAGFFLFGLFGVLYSLISEITPPKVMGST